MNNPLKFLDPYEKEDFQHYYGRESEIELLFDKVSRSRLTLMYGLPGTGKTSLVRCGLAHKLHEEKWLEIYVRRNDNLIDSLEKALRDTMVTTVSNGEKIIDLLKILYNDHKRSIYLVVDQFEELLISGDEQKETKLFFRTLNEILTESVDVHVILVLREEFLARLDKYEDIVPILFNNRFHLERMDPLTLERVIKEIARDADIVFSNDETGQSEEVESAIVKKIIDNLSYKFDKEEMHTIELPYLQVYLDMLCRKAPQKNKKWRITPRVMASLGDMEDIMGKFLEDQIRTIEKEPDRQQEIWDILKMLITDKDTRKSISMDNLLEKLSS